VGAVDAVTEGVLAVELKKRKAKVVSAVRWRIYLEWLSMVLLLTDHATSVSRYKEKPTWTVQTMISLLSPFATDQPREMALMTSITVSSNVMNSFCPLIFAQNASPSIGYPSTMSSGRITSMDRVHGGRHPRGRPHSGVLEAGSCLNANTTKCSDRRCNAHL